MTTFAYATPDIPSFGAQLAFNTFGNTKPVPVSTSDNIGNFLLGSDWSALSSLSPAIAPIRAIVEETPVWPASNMTDAPLFSSPVETAKASAQVSADEASFVSTSSPVDAICTPHEMALTPLHRHSFDACYSDSAASPDSDRDFLTSPSMFKDVDFELDADATANNVPLFGDNSYEDVAVPYTEDDTVNTVATDFETNVKLEAEDSDSQLIDASQATVMPQVKFEEDVYDFTSESPVAKEEPKYEEDMWSFNDVKPYFGDEDSKEALLSQILSSFAELQQPVQVTKPTASFDKQQASHFGPMRSSRANRRASPAKSATPAPVFDHDTKTKRWQCDDCGKLFDRAFNLKTHRITHQDPETRARPFSCPDGGCKKSFARKHDMQRHFENVHRGESRRGKSGSVKRNRADDLG